ncbi:hypothetical protein [Kribbella speibonae]|uniref:Uncharacterized protein n=1 Tax=Kribbella speibonae TaxID=1572660 RepID=A0A4R0J3Q6_9ACTN|nr:hypothetical protein [Kribbella speibonae]TCC35875.1 hypothetical protein E0H92_24565 [Kribbella speibonae]
MPEPTVDIAAPRVWIQKAHGETLRHYIRPADFRCTALAAELADAWLDVAPELPGSFGSVRDGIRSLLRYFDDAIHGPQSLSELSREQLDAWELHLVHIQRRDRAERHYRAVVHLFALLRRIDDDRPGYLRPEVSARLLRESRLHHIRRANVPPFPIEEVLALAETAGAMVRAALEQVRVDPSSFAGPDASLIAALHILVAASTGEPPEVIRRLTTDDVTPTYRRRRDGGPVQGSKLEALAVDYVKTRARISYTVGYTSRHPDALAAYGAVLELTAGPRAESGMKQLWLTRNAAGHVVQCNWKGLALLQNWCARYAPDLELSTPVQFRRIRKTVTTAEALDNPTRYLRTGRRHTPQTFLVHYATSPILRAEAGRVLVEAITTKFNAAVNGPTVVTPEAEDLIAAGEPAPGLDADLVKKAAIGELDTPTAACKDIKASPFAPAGQICPFTADGTCYTCGNALIMRHHLPGVLATVNRLAPHKAARMEDWNESWRDLYEYLTEHVLPSFSDDDIAAARQGVDEVPMSAGLLNQPRGEA